MDDIIRTLRNLIDNGASVRLSEVPPLCTKLKLLFCVHKLRLAVSEPNSVTAVAATCRRLRSLVPRDGVPPPPPHLQNNPHIPPPPPFKNNPNFPPPQPASNTKNSSQNNLLSAIRNYRNERKESAFAIALNKLKEILPQSEEFPIYNAYISLCKYYTDANKIVPLNTAYKGMQISATGTDPSSMLTQLVRDLQIAEAPVLRKWAEKNNISKNDIKTAEDKLKEYDTITSNIKDLDDKLQMYIQKDVIQGHLSKLEAQLKEVEEKLGEQLMTWDNYQIKILNGLIIGNGQRSRKYTLENPPGGLAFPPDHEFIKFIKNRSESMTDTTLFEGSKYNGLSGDKGTYVAWLKELLDLRNKFVTQTKLTDRKSDIEVQLGVENKKILQFNNIGEKDVITKERSLCDTKLKAIRDALLLEPSCPISDKRPDYDACIDTKLKLPNEIAKRFIEYLIDPTNTNDLNIDNFHTVVTTRLDMLMFAGAWTLKNISSNILDSLLNCDNTIRKEVNNALNITSYKIPVIITKRFTSKIDPPELILFNLLLALREQNSGADKSEDNTSDSWSESEAYAQGPQGVCVRCMRRAHKINRWS